MLHMQSMAAIKQLIPARLRLQIITKLNADSAIIYLNYNNNNNNNGSGYVQTNYATYVFNYQEP